MRRALLALILLTAPFLPGWTLNWIPVTTYTDGTAIEPEILGQISYDIRQDNVLRYTGTTGGSQLLDIADFGVAHTFEMQTKLASGEKSAWSPPFHWTSPPASEVSTPAKPPGGATAGLNR